LAVFVIKADGRKQLFDKEKIIQTCLRIGASREIAEHITNKIEAKVYNGMETRKILKMIFRLLGVYRPSIKHIVDLRKALSLMRPKPDFERFIQILLSEHGYEVTPNQIIRGKCVEHEVDAVVRKNGKAYMVEVKHHYNYHTPTGLDVSRIARAVFEDITEGFALGLHNLKIDEAMIICNTKLSNHAKRYTECRGIHHIGWGSPINSDLRIMIQKKKVYPVTYIKGLNKELREKLSNAGIILLKHLVTEKLENIKRKTGIPKKNIESLAKKAQMLLMRT